MGRSFLSWQSHNTTRLNGKGRHDPLTFSSAKRLRKATIEPLEHREMLTVVVQSIESLQATEGVVASQPITGLPQTLTGTVGVPLGQHSGAGFGEVIAGIRQDISAGPQIFDAVINHGDVVDDIYLRLLHRHADTAGQSFWTNWLNAGNADEQLIAAVSASDEYFGRSE